MGSCIICGSSVDGHICDTHEEDVVFEFRGDHPNQLTVDRYYRGSVDGFAEFGVFVDVGESVTGLLHRSELDQRLDSLDWDPGDTVFVKVKNVRDNGNIDLGWSIRQSDREFRGTLVDDPSYDHAKLKDDVEEAEEGNAREGGDASSSSDATESEEASSSTSERVEEAETVASGGSQSDPDAAAGAGSSVNEGSVEDTNEGSVEDATDESEPDDQPTVTGSGTVSTADDTDRIEGSTTIIGGESASSDASDDAESEVDASTETSSSPDNAGTGQAANGQSANTQSSTAATVEATAGGEATGERTSVESGDLASEGDASQQEDTEKGEADDADDGNGDVVDGAEDADEQAAIAAVETLEDMVGEDVTLEGQIVDVHQTGGPTIFSLHDETGTIDCAAFVEAGVRAYPEIETDDVVELVGEVRERKGELQVETEEMTVLGDERRDAVVARLDEALDERARPDSVAPIADDPVVDALGEELVAAATAIRKAVLTDRPVVVRHSATADGYVAGVAIERATLPLVEDHHTREDAVYHYFDRRPLEGGVYDMDDATRDATTMLENQSRHGEKVPLFVFVAAGGTRESLDGFELLDIYDAPRVVVDDVHAHDDVVDAVDTVVSPALADAGTTSAAALAANVAAHVDESVREELAHLPAVSFWDDVPEAYRDAAVAAGYDDVAVRELREAVALEAYYQSYEDKRELVADLLFGDEDAEVDDLAGNVARQFRTKLDDEVATARANLEVRSIDGVRLAVLDTDAFTHRFDFPPETLLLDELWRRLDEDGIAEALIGVDEDTIYLRGDAAPDVQDVTDVVAEAVPDAGARTRSARERSFRFLVGERTAVLGATLDYLADEL